MIGTVVTVWRWRRLAGMLAWREFKARYVGSALGAVWAVLEPGLQFAIYLTVFSYFLGMRFAAGEGVPSYALFLLSGLVPFWVLQESMQRAVGLARANANMVRRTSVPLEVLLTGSHLSVFLRHGVAFVILAVIAMATGALDPASAPWLVAGVAVLLVGTFALGLALVPIGAYLPDVGHVVGTATMLLFFASPVLYPLDRLPAGVRRLEALNPVVGVLEMFRAGFLGQPVAGGHLLVTVATVVVLGAAGSWIFSRRSSGVRDVV